MKKLHKLLIKSFIGPFIGTFFISLFLFLMQYLFKYIDNLVGKGLEWYIIVEFIFYSMIYLIPMALPLAVLLSSIMTTGNLGERYELAAMKSAGISLVKALFPMFIMMVIISTAAFFTSNNLIPKVNLRWGALLFDVSHKKPALNIQDGIFFKELNGYAIRVGHKHDDNQTLDDVLIYARADRKASTNVIIAKRGKMYVTEDERFLMLELFEGKRYQEMTNSRDYVRKMPHNLMSFDKYSMAINLGELEMKRTEPEMFSHDHRMLNVNELKEKIDSLFGVIDRTRRMTEGYIRPYFHFPTDSLVQTINAPDSITERSFEESITGHFSPQYRAEQAKRKSDLDSTENETSIDSTKALFAKGKMRNDPLSTVMGENEIGESTQQVSMPPEEETLELRRSRVLETARGQMRNIVAENKRKIEQIEREKGNMRKYEIEWHKKFTLAVSCLLLFFIGAPIGAIIRRGGFGLPFVISILIFIFYLAFSLVGEKLAKSGAIEVWQGVWLSSFILAPIAAFLTWKASTDSKLFDSDFYKKLFSFANVFSIRKRH